MTLLDTHPRLGKAWYAERFAHLDSERVSDILSHNLTAGTCQACGRATHRHVIRHRTIVGANRGVLGVFFNEVCRCGNGRASNYRAPWSHGRGS